MPEHPDRQVLAPKMPEQEMGEHQMLMQQAREPKEPEPNKLLQNSADWEGIMLGGQHEGTGTE